jgi:hypothetical protein
MFRDKKKKVPVLRVRTYIKMAYQGAGHIGAAFQHQADEPSANAPVHNGAELAGILTIQVAELIGVRKNAGGFKDWVYRHGAQRSNC